MKTRAKHTCAFTILILMLTASAQAQLSLSLISAVLSGPPGQTLTFSGSLANTSNLPLFLNGDTLDIAANGLSGDDTKFLVNSPLFLTPQGSAGDSWSGGLFDIQIDPATVPGRYLGAFTVLGGGDASANLSLAQVQFEVDVAAVPEPGLFAMLTGTAFFGGNLLLRRRRK